MPGFFISATLTRKRFQQIPLLTMLCKFVKHICIGIKTDRTKPSS